MISSNLHNEQIRQGDNDTKIGEINVTIDGIPIRVPENYTVLEAATKLGIHIPTLCYLEDINEIGACRVCVVEIDGANTLQAACVYPVREGMQVITNSAKVIQARKATVELILSNHDARCLTCLRNGNCELQSLANELGIRDITYTGERKQIEVQDDNVFIQRDYNKCITCYRCQAICANVQKCNVYSTQQRGFETVVAPYAQKDLGEVQCITCGQCVIACPVASLIEKEAIEEVWDAIQDPEKYVVVQTAPSIQVTIGEEFGMPVGTVVTGKLVTALRRLGFDKVFATDFSADLTIMEEANEFIHRLQNNGPFPFLTSCCPGWIKYCEHFFPDFIPNLSTCKSPHEMFGAITKSYFAQKNDIDPNKIVVVAIMPCTAKKFEAARPEMGTKQMQDVDYVLTTRELARMIRQAALDFPNLPENEYDKPLGIYTGAGTIFGATGGVMEAAVRTAYAVLNENEMQDNAGSKRKETQTVDFKEFRGQDGLKISNVQLGKYHVRIGVAHGIANAKTVLEAVQKGQEDFHYIEIMACPGGCVGGGGQPILGGRYHKTVSLDYRHNRADALYKIDYNKELRMAHLNEAVQQLYTEFLKEPLSDISKKYLHTKYYKRGLDPIYPDKIVEVSPRH
ncbi:NADH-dependent [FeFe] hydrogenase, group A6 [Clostridiaceae bacterium 35-E11]